MQALHRLAPQLRRFDETGSVHRPSCQAAQKGGSLGRKHLWVLRRIRNPPFWGNTPANCPNQGSGRGVLCGEGCVRLGIEVAIRMNHAPHGVGAKTVLTLDQLLQHGAFFFSPHVVVMQILRTGLVVTDELTKCLWLCTPCDGPH